MLSSWTADAEGLLVLYACLRGAGQRGMGVESLDMWFDAEQVGYLAYIMSGGAVVHHACRT
jgi:hypothetical protein